MNHQTVLDALEEAAIAYQEVQPVFAGETLVSVDRPDTGVQYFLRLRGETLRIAFRGSDAGKDWLFNLRFWKKEIPYGNTASPIRVHTGFITAYRSPGVRERIHTYMSPGVRRVRVTGHSYGAALALLCTLDLQYNFPDRDYEAILFGCPRVGNAAFADSYNRRVFKTLRVENGNDIVTKVPPALLGFRHAGVAVHTGAPRIPGAVSFHAHYPREYYRHLFKNYK